MSFRSAQHNAPEPHSQQEMFGEQLFVDVTPTKVFKLSPSSMLHVGEMLGGEITNGPQTIFTPREIIEQNGSTETTESKRYNVFSGIQLHSFTEIALMILKEVLNGNLNFELPTLSSYFPSMDTEKLRSLSEIISSRLSPETRVFRFETLLDIFDIWRFNHLPEDVRFDKASITHRVWLHPDIAYKVTGVIANFQHFLGVGEIEIKGDVLKEVTEQLVGREDESLMAKVLVRDTMIVMEPSVRIGFFLDSSMHEKLHFDIRPDIVALPGRREPFVADIKSSPEEYNQRLGRFKRLEHLLTHLAGVQVVRNPKRKDNIVLLPAEKQDIFSYLPQYHIYPTRMNKKTGHLDMGATPLTIPSGDYQYLVEDMRTIGNQLIANKASCWPILTTLRSINPVETPSLQQYDRLIHDLSVVRTYSRHIDYKSFLRAHSPSGEYWIQMPLAGLEI